MNEFFESIKKRDPAAKSIISIVLTYPGVKAILFHKLSHKLWKAKIYLIARTISQFSRFLTGIEIHPAAVIGKNLLFFSEKQEKVRYLMLQKFGILGISKE